MPRERVPLVFGGSMERGYGKMAVRPGSITDQRNVYLLHGKALVRRGMEETATFLDEFGDPLSDICGIWPQRTERVGIVVGYQFTTGRFYVYRVSAFGQDPVRLDVDHRTSSTAAQDIRAYWHEVDSYSDPPIIFLADSFQKLFIAHTDQDLGNRAPTVYYDPLATVPVQRLLLELRPGIAEDEQELVPTYFNGVVRHLQYIWGWGYGSALEPDRPEFLRHSLPGQPTSWDPNHYQIVGQRGEPIKNAVPAHKILVSLKDTELHQTTGYDRRTFGVQPLDPNYGIAAPRLACPFKRGVAFWDSSLGPRWTDGNSPSEPLDRDQLELLGLEPADLVEAGALEEGFAVDLLSRKVLYFFFGARGYAYHYGSDRSSWSYDPRGVPLFCAGELFVGDEAQLGPPTGHPEFIPEDDPYFPWDAFDTSAQPYVANIDPTGGEILEVWLRVVGDDWDTDPFAQYEVNGQPIQLLNPPLQGLTSNTDYEIAYRWRRGGSYAADYEGDTPDDWAPSADVSKGTFSTEALRRVLTSCVWSRVNATNEQILVSWTGGPVDTTDIDVSTDGVNFVSAATAQAGSSYVYDADSDGETYLFFRVKPNGNNAWSNIVEVWVGPLIPIGSAANNAMFGGQGFIITDKEEGAAPYGQVADAFDQQDPPQVIPDEWTLFTAFEVQSNVGINLWQVNWTTDSEDETSQAGTSAGDRTAVFNVTRLDGYVNTRVRVTTVVDSVEDFSDWTPFRQVPGSNA